MNKQNLKQNYETACNDYKASFLKKHGYDTNDSYWIADEVGGILAISDSYFADMHDIVLDINEDVKKGEFERWHDYCVELHMLGVEQTPNFKSWIKGFPRKSEAEIEAIRKSRSKAEEAKQELEKLLNEKTY